MIPQLRELLNLLVVVAIAVLAVFVLLCCYPGFMWITRGIWVWINKTALRLSIWSGDVYSGVEYGQRRYSGRRANADTRLAKFGAIDYPVVDHRNRVVVDHGPALMRETRVKGLLVPIDSPHPDEGDIQTALDTLERS